MTEDNKVIVSPGTNYSNHTNYRLSILSSITNTDCKLLTSNVRFDFKVTASNVSQLAYMENFEVKNTSGKLEVFKLDSPADYIAYDQHRNVAYAEMVYTGQAYIPANGTAIVSYDAIPEIELVSKNNLVVTQTSEQAFLRVKQQKGSTVSWTAPLSETPIIYTKNGLLDYVQ